MARLREWIGGARLRTLPLSIAPVALGTGAGGLLIDPGQWHPWRAVLALAVAVTLQIGVNYANDYSDGVRGTDDFRVGPSRLTGSGAARPRHVAIVALIFFALSALAGLVLTLLTGAWWMLAVGAVALAAGWFYSGGRFPYGYYGLGELGVFVFFGIIATAGSTFVQAGHVNFESWVTGGGMGLIACCALMANNIRDRDTDRAAGKRTLAVLMPQPVYRILYVVALLVPFVIAGLLAVVYPPIVLVLFGLLAALPACLIVLTAKSARELVLVLHLTSLVAVIYGVGLGVVFAL